MYGGYCVCPNVQFRPNLRRDNTIMLSKWQAGLRVPLTLHRTAYGTWSGLSYRSSLGKVINFCSDLYSHRP